MIALVYQIKRERFLVDCCRYRTAEGLYVNKLNVKVPQDLYDCILELHIGEWIDDLDEIFIKESTSQYKRISLHIHSVSSLRSDQLTAILKYVAPKLIALEIIQCSSLSWKDQIRKILEKASSIETFTFLKNTWVDDSVLEFIAIKFAKSFRSLSLENCSKITNHCLHQIGKKCLNIDAISLRCCGNITDLGLIELAKNVRLRNLELSHNICITDIGILSLIANSSQMSTLVLTNCPKLSDESIGALYEAHAAWGKKRNHRIATLKTLELRDNYNFTTQIFSWISATAKNITSLDLRNCCSDLDLTKGMEQLVSLTGLKTLYLGPTNIFVAMERFAESLQYHMANLVILYLDSILGMDDQGISDTISFATTLEEITLIDMDFGTRTIETLCSVVPNTEKVTLVGSSQLRDADLRCLTKTCKFLSEISIQKCKLITSEGFNRCKPLKQLTKLDISHCSNITNMSNSKTKKRTPPIVSNIFQHFESSSIETLNMDGVQIKDLVRDLQALPKGCFLSIKNISCKHSPYIRLQDVDYIISHFPFLSTLDLTGCPASVIGLLKDSPCHNSLLVVDTDSEDFQGYRSSVKNQRRVRHCLAIQSVLREHIASRRISGLIRAVVKNKLSQIIAKQRQDEILLERWRNFQIGKVQGKYRIGVAKQRVFAIRQAGRIIVKSMRSIFLKEKERLEREKWRDVMLHYKATFKRRMFLALKERYRASREKYALSEKGRTLEIEMNRKLAKKSFGHIDELYSDIQERVLSEYASSMWQAALLIRVMKSWKRILLPEMGSTISTRVKYARALLLALDMSYHNSLRQQKLLNLANFFRHAVLITPAWMCLGDDYRRSRAASLKIPFAEKYFKQVFFLRVSAIAFRAIALYMGWRRAKHKLKARGDERNVRWQQRSGMGALRRRVKMAAFNKKTAARESKSREYKLLKDTLRNELTVYAKSRKERRKKFEIEIPQYKNYGMILCLRAFGTYAGWVRRIWQLELQAIAKCHFRNRKLGPNLRDWKAITDIAKQGLSKYTDIYDNRIKKKTFNALANFWRTSKDYLRTWQVRMFVRTEEWRDDLIMKRESISMEKEDQNANLVMADLPGEELPFPSDQNVPARIPSLDDLEVLDLEQSEESFSSLPLVMAEENPLVAQKIEEEILPVKNNVDKISPDDVMAGGSSESLGFEVEGERKEGGDIIASGGSGKLDIEMDDVDTIEGSVDQEKGSSLVISVEGVVESMKIKQSVDKTNREIKPRWRVVNIDREMDMNLVIKRLRRFQAAFRAGKIRATVRAMKVEKISAIMLIQRCIRGRLARKRMKGKIRLKFLLERDKEILESLLMRDEDNHVTYVLYWNNAALQAQRVFRGWKVRLAVYLTLGEMVINRETDFYNTLAWIRFRYDANIKSLEAKAKFKIKQCILIQKLARGVQGRMKANARRKHVFLENTVSKIQRAFRRHLARLKLQALRRSVLNEKRLRTVKRDRAALLRLVGVKTRAKNKIGGRKGLMRFIEVAGIDPITFNIYLASLVEETYLDGKKLVQIVKREFNILRQYKLFDFRQKLQARKNGIVTDGYFFSLWDAVRITEIGHAYLGYTGLVVRIDDNIPGHPLYEIKLDAFNVITYVQMNSDVMHHYTSTTTPLIGIENIPVLRLKDHPQPFLIYGLHPNDEFYQRKNVTAAWTIQRAYRMYRSKRIVAKKRFDMWERSSALHWNLLQHLGDSNALTTEGLKMALAYAGNPLKPIKVQALSNMLIPQRLLAVLSKGAESLAIRGEFNDHVRRRGLQIITAVATGESHSYFLTGFEPWSLARRMAALVRIIFGLSPIQQMEKPVKQLKDLSGAQGVRYLAQKKSMVAGLDMYAFSEFKKSSHVRYPLISLYQGEWSGIPLFTPLIPHGEGMVIFFDAWGFSKEVKMLKLKIIKCAFLEAVNFDRVSSDPFVEIYCNERRYTTTIKYKTLHPVFNESFEIDVTNPLGDLTLVVRDSPQFPSPFFRGTFLGQIKVTVGDYADGLEHIESHALVGENARGGKYDRGDIEISVQWTDRLMEYDLEIIALKRLMATRLQSWMRRLEAKWLTRVMLLDRVAMQKMANRCAELITATFRMKVAIRRCQLQRLYQIQAFKIQMLARMYIAKVYMFQRRIDQRAAIKIQCLVRQRQAHKHLLLLRKLRKILLYDSATAIQKHIRRFLAEILACEIFTDREEDRENERNRVLEEQVDLAVDLATEVVMGLAVDEAIDLAMAQEVEGVNEDMREIKEKEDPTDMMFEREDDQEAKVKTFIDEEALLAKELKEQIEEEKLQKILLFEQKTKYEKKIFVLSEFRRRLNEVSMSNIPLDPWFGTFGRDSVYGTKRLARITKRLFKQAICTENMRIFTRYGVVYVKDPAVFSSLSEEDMEVQQSSNRDLGRSSSVAVEGMDESSSLSLSPTILEDPVDTSPQDIELKQGDQEGQPYMMSELSDLRKRSAFLNVYVPTFNSDVMHKDAALLLLHASKTPYIGELHIATSLYVQKTVHRLILTIQCLRRQIKARKRYRQLNRALDAFRIFQKRMLIRYQLKNRMASKIAVRLQMKAAKIYVEMLRHEFKAARTIQCIFRKYCACFNMFNRRCVGYAAAMDLIVKAKKAARRRQLGLGEESSDGGEGEGADDEGELDDDFDDSRNGSRNSSARRMKYDNQISSRDRSASITENMIAGAHAKVSKGSKGGIPPTRNRANTTEVELSESQFGELDGNFFKNNVSMTGSASHKGSRMGSANNRRQDSERINHDGLTSLSKDKSIGNLGSVNEDLVTGANAKLEEVLLANTSTSSGDNFLLSRSARDPGNAKWMRGRSGGSEGRGGSELVTLGRMLKRASEHGLGSRSSDNRFKSFQSRSSDGHGKSFRSRSSDGALVSASHKSSAPGIPSHRSNSFSITLNEDTVSEDPPIYVPTTISVLKYSGFEHYHGPQRVLEWTPATAWISGPAPVKEVPPEIPPVYTPAQEKQLLEERNLRVSYIPLLENSKDDIVVEDVEERVILYDNDPDPSKGTATDISDDDRKKPYGEIRFEFSNKELIGEIWIMASMSSASPATICVHTVTDKSSKEFEPLVTKKPLILLKGLRWQRVGFKPTLAKYFKVTFRGSYGHIGNVAVQQIRFMKCREAPVEITHQSLDEFTLELGPSLEGQHRNNSSVIGGNSSTAPVIIRLECHATGWPPPTYQWYKGGNPIPNACSETLELVLSQETLYEQYYKSKEDFDYDLCDMDSNKLGDALQQGSPSTRQKTRVYRCGKCKRISKEVPFVAYSVQCGNCRKPFVYDEISLYEDALKEIISAEEEIRYDRNLLLENRVTLRRLLEEGEESDKKVANSILAPINKKYEEDNCRDFKPLAIKIRKNTLEEQENIILFQDLNIRIKDRNQALLSIQAERLKFKETLPHSYKFHYEGIYQCRMKNTQGAGSFIILKRSHKMVVSINRPSIFVMKMSLDYIPRPLIPRRKWLLYSSMIGTYKNGRVAGLVTIRYTDGSTYEGPYVGEAWLDPYGHVMSKGRAKNHYGIFTSVDGRVWEGGNVDNHFDPHNLQKSYRLTFPNKEKYEGAFVDEYYHGEGEYTYLYGSLYEGSWDQGHRHGHGHMRFTLENAEAQLAGVIAAADSVKVKLNAIRIAAELKAKVNPPSVVMNSQGQKFQAEIDKLIPPSATPGIVIVTEKSRAAIAAKVQSDRLAKKGMKTSTGMLALHKMTAMDPLDRSGWSYEGMYEWDKREGEGVINWGDGSTYIGEWMRDVRHGRGVFVSRLMDVYKGDFRNNNFHGAGELTYSDGSRFQGRFKEGMRHGRGVLFSSSSGSTFYGQFVNDKEDGEMVVKAPTPESVINVAPRNAGNSLIYEVRVAIFKDGLLVRYKSQFSNPLATRQFVNLFMAPEMREIDNIQDSDLAQSSTHSNALAYIKDQRAKDEMYASTFGAMVLAHLPELPQGVDLFDEDVQEVLRTLQEASGAVPGKSKSEIETEERMEGIRLRLKDRRLDCKDMEKTILELTKASIRLQGEAMEMEKECSGLSTAIQKEEFRLDTFWINESSNSKNKFRAACKNLEQFTGDDFFLFKSHRFPPPFVKKITLAIYMLLMKEGDSEKRILLMDWTKLQMIISDNIYNCREGDDEAMLCTYTCKLIYLMIGYNVHDHCCVDREVSPVLPYWMRPLKPPVYSKEKMLEKATQRYIDMDKNLLSEIHDPRLRTDSYYVESCGPVAGALVTWIKASFAYILVARTVHERFVEMEKRRSKAKYLMSLIVKKREQLTAISTQLSTHKDQMAALLIEIGETEEALAQGEYVIQFLEDARAKLLQKELQRDYYEQLTYDLEHGGGLQIEGLLVELKEIISGRADNDRDKLFARIGLLENRNAVKARAIASAEASAVALQGEAFDLIKPVAHSRGPNLPLLLTNPSVGYSSQPNQRGLQDGQNSGRSLLSMDSGVRSLTSVRSDALYSIVLDEIISRSLWSQNGGDPNGPKNSKAPRVKSSNLSVTDSLYEEVTAIKERTLGKIGGKYGDGPIGTRTQFTRYAHEYEERDPLDYQIKTWLSADIRAHQASLLEQGYSLPTEYDLDPLSVPSKKLKSQVLLSVSRVEATEKLKKGFKKDIRIRDGGNKNNNGEDNRVYIDARYAQSLINQSVEAVAARIDDALNKPSPLYATVEIMMNRWRMQLRDGRVVTARFLYVTAWNCWIEEAVLTEEARAVHAWEAIFGYDDSIWEIKPTTLVDSEGAILSEHAISDTPDELSRLGSISPSLNITPLAITTTPTSTGNIIVNKEDLQPVVVSEPEPPVDRMSKCLRMALECRYSAHMSDIAREQGMVWVKKHPIEAKRAEPILADEFEAQYAEDTATWALNIIDAYYSSDRSYLSNEAKAELDEHTRTSSGALLPPRIMVMGTNPKVLIGAFAWMKLHPSEMQDASEVRSLALSEMFVKKFTAGSKGSSTAPSAEPKSKKAKEKEKAKEALRQARQGPASTAFKIFNGLAKDETAAQWIKHAEHWRAFNTEEYEATGITMMAEAAATFLLAAASPDKIEEPVMGTVPANDLTVKGKKKDKGDKKNKGKGDQRPSSRETSDSDSASTPSTRPGTSGTSGSRPGTSGTSSGRPGTSSSTRPSTAERPESSSELNSERKLLSKPEETPTDGETKTKSRPGTSNKSDQKKTSIETKKILANAAALAATILEDESISLLIVDETVALDYRQDRTFLFQANCWGEQNQGLLRGALTTLRLANQSKSNRLWKDLQLVTSNFQKGSYLLLTREMRGDITLDPSHIFRQDLLKKYSWLHGYYGKVHDDLLGSLRDHDMNDPTSKGKLMSLPGIRPSEEDEMRDELFQQHGKDRKKMEKLLVGIMGKLSGWNSYFGVRW